MVLLILEAQLVHRKDLGLTNTWAGVKVVGVIDCDSAVANTFDSEDCEYLEKLASRLSSACNW